MFYMLHTVWLYLNELKCHKEVTWLGCVWIYDLVSDHKKNISSRFYNTVDFNFGPPRIFQFQPTFWVFIEFLDHSKFKNFIKFHQIFIYVKSYLTKMDISERASRSNLQNIYVTAKVFHVVAKSCLGLLMRTHFGSCLAQGSTDQTRLDPDRASDGPWIPGLG